MIDDYLKSILEKYDIDTNECIIWKGAYINKGKTPVIHYKCKTITITRLLLGLERRLDLACHICNNSKCINKKHLYKGNHKTNALDSIRDLTHYESKRKYMTHCENGHEFTEKNTRIYNGKKQCRDCFSRYMRTYREKKSI